MPRRANGRRIRARGSRRGARNEDVPFVSQSRDIVTGLGAARRLGNLTGMPDRMEVDLAYNVNARVNPGAVAYSDTLFDLNNLYDPERTGTGHQPREFDQLAALYLYYRVYAAKVEVEVRQRASHGIRAVIVADNSGTALTPSTYPAENRRAWVSPVTGSNQPAIRYIKTYDIASILGMTRAQFLASEDTDSAVTTAPDLIALLHMYVEQVDGSTAVDFEYSMKITFRAVFHEKKTLGISLAAPSVDQQDFVSVAGREPLSAAEAAARAHIAALANPPGASGRPRYPRA